MSDPEPRRSVRATKGQHKALEQLDQTPEAPKKRGKKGKKAAAAEPEESEVETIRCICGATDQEADQGDEPWIACDVCGAWQHNICMGLSQFVEDLPKKYFCEQCRPEDHKELLEAIDRGEKPWETWRKAYEDEKEKKKKEKGPKKAGRKRRGSDLKEEVVKSQKSKSSPMPEPKEVKEAKEPKAARETGGSKEAKEPKSAGPLKKEAEKEKEKEKEPKAAAAGQKRKTVDGAQEKETKKVRKVSETQAVPLPSYIPPDDIPAKLAELPDARQPGTKLLVKSLSHSLGIAEKKGEFVPIEGDSVADRAERLALQIERAVHDSHPSQQAYTGQIRSLGFNLKSNPGLCSRLLAGALTPTMLAAMKGEELASEELQKDVAVMKARAEKQAIKITEDIVPRVRRTHKGDELIGDDTFMGNDEVSSAPVPRPAPKKAARTEQSTGPAQPGQSSMQDLSVDTQHSPSRTDFDINKVFSSVKSPTLPQNQQRSLSVATAPATGPGVDPDVDRLLDDEPQSPPYSPSAKTDPDIVWRGNLVMNTIATVSVTAKHIGGAKLDESIKLPYTTLIPKSLSVCGRIDEQQAVVYLCGLRYNAPTDVVVVNLEPSSEASRPEFNRIFEYFVSKKRYGVIGDKGVANVRDTYLVPVLPGTGNHPEFMLNLQDNFIPETRTQPMLLAVFVYRNDPQTMERLRGASETNQAGRQQSLPQLGQPGFVQSPGTPTPPQPGFPHHGRQSISGPAFSPTSPQGQFPPYAGQPGNPPLGPQQANQSAGRLHLSPEAQKAAEAQRAAEAVAHEILGPLIMSETVGFLLPQAQKMSRSEWEVIKGLYERDPLTRHDLPHLSRVLEKEGRHASSGGSATESGTGSTPTQRRRSQPQQAPTAGSTPAPAVETPIPPPQQPPAVRNTPILPPPIPQAAAPVPPRQTPIPPPPIPPQATATAGAPPA
ncbi:SPOC domain-containing protein [Immersiella caudata]|uniref:Transcription factor BYE1 n=1 Tax=Immersiella caudata TaxID=314043 RepID=A0AA40BX68_9PEZI|nr:SPOC domain-containing protein [Immersiella caudata]